MEATLNRGATDCTKGEIVMYQTDETIKLEVRVENETVWLTQQQLVELFKSSKGNISDHIKNIYEQGELRKSSTVRKIRTVFNLESTYSLLLRSTHSLPLLTEGTPPC